MTLRKPDKSVQKRVRQKRAKRMKRKVSILDQDTVKKRKVEEQDDSDEIDAPTDDVSGFKFNFDKISKYE